MKQIIKINEKKSIGNNKPVYIIAEMSANHGGSFDRAIEIIHAAKKSGADCIKIQTYTPETMTLDSDKDYFKIKSGTWKGENLYDLYGKAYTHWEWHEQLKEEAEKLGLDFLSTPFDKSSVDFLEKLDLSFYKVASFELTDIPLIKYIASKGKPIIMSTGMGTLGEIEEAVEAVRSQNNNNLCLLKCSSAYPAIPEDMNLKTIRSMSETFNVPIGLSDHSLGSVTAITAVAMGAKVIEKHMCISRDIDTADSSFSMEPFEFKKMVDDIRQAEKAIGTVNYSLSKEEKKSRIFRRSIFVSEDVKKGEIFTENNIKIVRPNYGLEPKYYNDVLGKTASSDIQRGEPLEEKLINE